MDEVVIAVDIGGGSVKLALTNADTDEIAIETIEDVPGFDRDGLLGEIGGRAAALLEPARAGRLIGMAIGVPGHVSPDRRASLNSNVPVLDGTDLVGHFGERFGCEVRLENDANLAALGEWAFGVREKAGRFMMVTLGTGIGVALLDQGAPVGVVGGTLGDAGHVIVDPAAGRSCRLGCSGCLESVASGLALTEAAEDLARRFPESGPGQRQRRGEAIDSAGIAALAAARDETTLSLLRDTGRWLGMGLASYINIFAPEVICIGGGMSRLRPYIEAAMLVALEQGRIKNREGAEVYFSSEYERAAGRGAVALFFGAGSASHG